MTRLRTTTSETARRNVRAISQLERESLRNRKLGERVSDAVNCYAGTTAFIVFHIIWFVGWLFWNSSWSGLPKFDPYPYQLLTLVVSLEAIFLSLFILMSQNRMNKQADQRSHLDLQINLLAEFETTKILQMLHSICEHLGLDEANDKEVQDLKTRTQPETILRELKNHMP